MIVSRTNQRTASLATSIRINKRTTQAIMNIVVKSIEPGLDKTENSTASSPIYFCSACCLA
jgi:hypothetical protein